MVKVTGSEREPWHVLHRKSSHNLVKLFGAAILMGFSFHLLFCHNPVLHVSDAPITIQKVVETSIGLVEEKRDSDCLPVPETPVAPEKTDTHLVLIDGNGRSINFLPLSEVSITSQRPQTQLLLVEGNHSTAFFPLSEIPVSSQEDTQVELVEGKRSTSSVPVSEATVASPNVETQVKFVDEKQDRGQKDIQVELGEGNRSTSAVPVSEAPVPPPKVEAQVKVNFVDEKQKGENAERRKHNKVIRRWRITRARCDMYKGHWVYDESYPFYNVSSCPFLPKEYDCLKYGRPDKSYLKYRWKPNGCELPRFNALDFLWRWRGKKIMFVGDSFSGNNWQSLVCMLHAVVPPGTTSGRKKGNVAIIRFEEYDVEIQQHWQPYLVDIVKEDVGKVLRLNSLQSNGTDWSGVDVLVFNSWYWWWSNGAAKPFDYIHDGEKLLKEMNRLTAFTHALNTWANWVNSGVDTTKTAIVYQGVSPSHLSGREWGQPKKADCQGEEHPVTGSTNPLRLLPPQPIVKQVLSRISKPVHLLDITQLSQLRKDAHPAKYNGLHQLDCWHWCVGGLPDTWNQLLYAALV